MTTNQHSPTPWHLGFWTEIGLDTINGNLQIDMVRARVRRICQESNHIIAWFRDDETALHMLRSVNAHDDLVKSLNECIAELEICECAEHPVIQRARAALAKAKL